MGGWVCVCVCLYVVLMHHMCTSAVYIVISSRLLRPVPFRPVPRFSDTRTIENTFFFSRHRHSIHIRGG